MDHMTQGTLIIKTAPFEDIYYTLIEKLLNNPDAQEKNERTGSLINTIHGGVSFKLDLGNLQLPTPKMRKVYPHIAAAEVAWYMSGNTDVRWLQSYAKIWDKFVEDDGYTIESAYGYRWRNHFGRDQIQDSIDALKANPSDRRVVVIGWDPAQDGLLNKDQKNVPCPFSFTFSIVDDTFHSNYFIRSSDTFVGLPYDIMGHSMLMMLVKNSINPNLKLGTMHVTLAHPHLYEAHFDQAKAGLMVDPDQYANPANLPWSVQTVEDMKDAFVAAYKQASLGIKWPNYNPKVDVIV